MYVPVLRDVTLSIRICIQLAHLSVPSRHLFIVNVCFDRLTRNGGRMNNIKLLLVFSVFVGYAAGRQEFLTLFIVKKCFANKTKC